MENLSWYVYFTFALTVVLAVWLFIKATGYSRSFLAGLIVWIFIQSAVGISGFYSNADSMTKRFPLLVLPPLIFLISLFITSKGKAFIDSLSLSALTIFHIIRIPVELVLFWLYLNKSIPAAMTFEGRNFDILSGLSAPLIYYFGFVKKKIGKWGLLAWNIACIVLLLNVVSSAVLSLPERYQQFGFEQPNTALGHFPFLLLPAILVPLALFSNLAASRQLFTKKILA